MNFSEENIMIALSYLIPGFLINTIISKKFQLKKDSSLQSLYKFLLFSIVNMTFYTLVDYIFNLIFSTSLVTQEVFIIFLRNILSPICLAFLILKMSGDKSLRENYDLTKLMIALGFDKISRTESAWDYVISELENNSSYVIVTLKNGETIYGGFGVKSYATFQNGNKNSLYLEDTFYDCEYLQSTGYGILINENDILTVEIDKTKIKPEILPSKEQKKNEE